MKTRIKKSVLDMTQIESYMNKNETVILVGNGSIVLDMSTAPAFKINLVANSTITFSSKFPNVNDQSFSFLQTRMIIKQDSTGGKTVTWPSNCIWTTIAPPAINTAANSVTMVEMITFDFGSTWFCKKHI